MTSQQFKKIHEKLPDEPGVYFFLGSPKSDEGGSRAHRKILYIGKATSLRDRVKSYFDPDLIKTRGPKLVDMVTLASKIDFTKTDSVLEALILEANLIKLHQPKYNTDEKDNKSYNYVVITDEAFPKVLTIRGRTLAARAGASEKFGSTRTPSTLDSGISTENGRWEWRKFSDAPARAAVSFNGKKLKYIFGPFPHGGQLKVAMKIIRRIFPYSDEKCVTCDEQMKKSSPLPAKERPRLREGGEDFSSASRGCRPCFNRQIGLCPGVCTGEISQEDYGRQISHIKLFFEGKKKALVKLLEKEMKGFAKEQKFEEAARIRGTLFALNHIQDIALLKAENKIDESTGGTFTWNPSLRGGQGGVSSFIFRIEAYDVAHSSGKDVVGVMVVVEDGEPNKSQYRKFRIRINPGVNDPAALKEILRRRLGHLEWPLPGLIVVDGNQVQINAARSVLKERKIDIDIVSVVKDERHKPREVLGDTDVVSRHGRAILLANAEAHRFAIAYHRRRRDRIL